MVPRVELEACLAEDALRRASYRAEDARLLLASGLLAPFDGERLELAPGIAAHRLGGHSDGVCVVTVESQGKILCFWSDVVPTRNHVNPLYIMAYDQDAVASHAARRPWIERAAAEGWINALYHDPLHGFVRFTREGIDGVSRRRGRIGRPCRRRAGSFAFAPRSPRPSSRSARASASSA